MVRRLAVFGLLACAAATLVTSTLPAQAIGTECWNSGGMLHCNTQVGLLYEPPAGYTIGQSFMALAQIIQQQRAVRALQEQRAAERDVLIAATAAEREREAAARRLYVERVTAVLQQVGDSLRIQGEVARQLGQAVAQPIADLYLVNPTASREQIIEVMWPHIAELNRRFEAFLGRVVPPVRPTVDTLALTAEEMQLFLRALLPVSQDVFMTKPEATPGEYRLAIQPLLDRARVYFDSIRAAPRPR